MDSSKAAVTALAGEAFVGTALAGAVSSAAGVGAAALTRPLLRILLGLTAETTATLDQLVGAPLTTGLREARETLAAPQPAPGSPAHRLWENRLFGADHAFAQALTFASDVADPAKRGQVEFRINLMRGLICDVLSDSHSARVHFDRSISWLTAIQAEQAPEARGRARLATELASGPSAGSAATKSAVALHTDFVQAFERRATLISVLQAYR